MPIDRLEQARRPPRFGIAKVIGLLLCQLLLINALRHSFGFECYKEDLAFCDIAKNALLAAYGFAAAFALVAFFARRQLSELLAEADLRPGPLAANVAGLALLVATLPLLRSEPTEFELFALSATWALGAGLLSIGSALLLAPIDRWRAFVSNGGPILLSVLVAGAFAPYAALQARAFWQGDLLADWTFQMVLRIMDLWGQPVTTLPGQKVIGSEDFMINVAPSCSGIEGLALTTIFSLIYLTLFRGELRFPRALLILPIGLCLSWLLNSIRIAVLIQIGIGGYPELAVGGFHSHAGWLMFTILSLGIVILSQSIPFLKKHQARAATPQTAFLKDPAVAQILPFFVFVLSALLVSTFTEDAGAYYPVRALAMAAALLAVWPYLRQLYWRVDSFAVAAGIFVAAYWIYFAPSNDDFPPYAGFGPVFVSIWIVCRIVGTSLFVPVIEELFFRGYLLDRLSPKQAPVWRVIAAVLISSALFAALHGRFAEAAAAGVIFALVKLRKNNVADAIVAHMIANALIAAWAVWMQDWGAI